MGGILDVWPHPNKDLSNDGTHFLGVNANLGFVDRHITPAQNLQAFCFNDLVNHAATFGLDLWRQENHANAIFSACRQVNIQDRSLAFKQLGGQLNQHARPVASLRITPSGAAMAKVNQNLHTFINNLVCLLALYVGNNSHTASIMLLLRGVESFLS